RADRPRSKWFIDFLPWAPRSYGTNEPLCASRETNIPFWNGSVKRQMGWCTSRPCNCSSSPSPLWGGIKGGGRYQARHGPMHHRNSAPPPHLPRKRWRLGGG